MNLIKYFKKKYIILLLSFLIYTIFFCKLGNTCYRLNSNGIKKIMIIPLFTEGFKGPIRSIFLLLKQLEFYKLINYINFELKNLANPYSTFLFVNGIYNVLKFNKII